MYTNTAAESWKNVVHYDNTNFLANPATFPLSPSPEISSFTRTTTAHTLTKVTIYAWILVVKFQLNSGIIRHNKYNS